MTVFTLARSETQHQPAACCTFQQQVLESGRKWVDVKMLNFYPSIGWVRTMGRGDGLMTVQEAREFYRRLLERGYASA
jgi:hypothetical protein